MNKLKPWLLLALMFLAGFASGVVVTRVAVRHFVRRVIAHPEIIRARIERELDRNLKLDPQQELKVHQILVEAHGRIQSLRAEVQPQWTSIVQEARHEIADILTPEQREKFEKYQAENRPFWQSR